MEKSQNNNKIWQRSTPPDIATSGLHDTAAKATWTFYYNSGNFE